MIYCRPDNAGTRGKRKDVGQDDECRTNGNHSQWTCRVMRGWKRMTGVGRDISGTSKRQCSPFESMAMGNRLECGGVCGADLVLID